jgi:hypothetical protein
MKTFATQLHKALGGKSDVLCLDLPNHGLQSSSDMCSMDYIDLAGDIRHTLTSLGVAKCHLVGSSIGGKAAAATALPSSADLQRALPAFQVLSVSLLDVCPLQTSSKDLLRVSPTPHMNAAIALPELPEPEPVPCGELTLEQLRAFDGSDSSKPLYLVSRYGSELP